MTVLSFDLPWPPSANRLWRFVRGKPTPLKSAEYRKWIVAASQRIGPVDTIRGPYTMILEAYRPDRRRRDLGNLEKPVSDLLQAAFVIEDDCNAQCITLKWADEIKQGGLVRIWIKPLEERE